MLRAPPKTCFEIRRKSVVMCGPSKQGQPSTALLDVWIDLALCVSEHDALEPDCHQSLHMMKGIDPDVSDEYTDEYI